jgi:hypothetical protein
MLGAERLTAAPVPVPLRLMDCWLPAALLLLSVTIIEAARLPGAVGVNVTLMVQLAPAATEVPQVLVCPKSAALAPENVMLVMERAAFPVLFRVPSWALLVVLRFWLGKLRPGGVKPATGAVPVPVRLTLCVLLATLLSLSVMVTVAARLPVAAGVNVTLIVQVPAAATEVPHVFV